MRLQPKRLVCLALLATTTTGCALVFTEGPPSGHEGMAAFKCSESKIPPNLDLVWAGLMVANGVLVAADDTYDDTAKGALAPHAQNQLGIVDA